MNMMKSDKLSQIRLKYGYNHKGAAQENTNVQQFLSDIQRSKRDGDLFQNIQINNKPQQKKVLKDIGSELMNKPNTLDSSSFNNYSRCRSNSSNYYTNPQKIQESKVDHFQHSFGQKQPQQSAKDSKCSTQYFQKEDQQVNMDPIESYEKTYNLLRNYRNKIKTSFQIQNNNQPMKNKKLQIKEDKENRIPQERKNKKETFPESKYRMDQFISQRRYSQPKQCLFSQQKSKKQARYSPLQGVDTNIVDVKKQLTNIDQLQSKIKSVLGIK